jgi:hypothetical protein
VRHVSFDPVLGPLIGIFCQAVMLNGCTSHCITRLGYDLVLIRGDMVSKAPPCVPVSATIRRGMTMLRTESHVTIL